MSNSTKRARRLRCLINQTREQEAKVLFQQGMRQIQQREEQQLQLCIFRQQRRFPRREMYLARISED